MLPSFAPAKQKGNCKINYKTIYKKICKEKRKRMKV
jgi:hypothetical protein